MDKQVDLAQNPALDPEERERQLKGEGPDQEQKQTYQRSTYLIDRDFQYRFATTWIAAVILYVGLICLGFYWAAGVVDTSAQQQQITTVLADVSTYVGVFVLLLTILFGVYFLLLSHRISGPAYRLTESLKRIASGDFYFTVRLRKSDYLQSTADAMNTLLESLRKRDRSLGDVENRVAELKERLEERDDIDEEQDELIQECEKIHERIRSIRTPDDPDSHSDSENGE